MMQRVFATEKHGFKNDQFSRFLILYFWLDLFLKGPTLWVWGFL